MSDPPEPTAGRGSGNKSFKMSIGKKKLHANPQLARMIYGKVVLNGVQYCRPHYMLYCHICEENNLSMKEEVDEEREMLGLRPGGDPRINKKAEEWADFIQEKQLQLRLEVDINRQRYGNNLLTDAPDVWEEMGRKNSIMEREINDRFLAIVQRTLDEGASECCYWACSTPAAEKLLRCSGCRVAKYCSKEHHALDWKWEHKGECSQNVPQFVLDEIASDRQRNLDGDYSLVER